MDSQLTLKQTRSRIVLVSKAGKLTRDERYELLAERTTLTYYLHARNVTTQDKKHRNSPPVKHWQEGYMKAYRDAVAADKQAVVEVINLKEGSGNSQMWRVDFLEDHYPRVKQYVSDKLMGDAD